MVCAEECRVDDGGGIVIYGAGGFYVGAGAGREGVGYLFPVSGEVMKMDT